MQFVLAQLPPGVRLPPDIVYRIRKAKAAGTKPAVISRYAYRQRRPDIRGRLDTEIWKRHAGAGETSLTVFHRLLRREEGQPGERSE
jgi:hypothetical protein